MTPTEKTMVCRIANNAAKDVIGDLERSFMQLKEEVRKIGRLADDLRAKAEPAVKAKPKKAAVNAK